MRAEPGGNGPAEVEEAEPAETKSKSSNDPIVNFAAKAWSSLSMEDKRLAIITFTATLAANVAAIVFIAIGYAAYNLGNSAGSRDKWIHLAWLVALVALGSSLILPKFFPRIWLVCYIICYSFVFWVFFMTLGMVASIK